MNDLSKYERARSLCLTIALLSTLLLATAGAAANGEEVSRTAHEVAAWPIHVVLGSVALGSVWLSMHFGWRNNKLAFERDRINSEAIGKVTEAMLAMRDVEMKREIALNRMYQSIEHSGIMKDDHRHRGTKGRGDEQDQRHHDELARRELEDDRERGVIRTARTRRDGGNAHGDLRD